jgi:hypothetical protein
MGFGQKGKTMTGAMVAFGVAVAGTSMICYALMTRAERIKRNRRSAGDTTIDSCSTSGSEGWAVVSWFGGHHSWIVRTISAAVAGEAATAAMAGVAAIDATGPRKRSGF